MKFIFITILLSLISLSTTAGIDEKLISNQDNTELGIKNNEFNLLVWATNEVAAKECKSDGELPRSFYLWRDMSLQYSKEEKLNDVIFQQSMEDLTNAMNTMMKSTSGTDPQTDSILLQLTSVDVLIFNFVKKIDIKINLMDDIDFSLQNAVIDNKKWLASYDDFLNLGLKKSLEIANKGCKEKPAVKDCDKAIDILTSISNNELIELKKEYNKKIIDSKIKIDKIKKIETQIANAINSLPDGSYGYNWRAPITEEYNKLNDTRKKVGISCPNSLDSKSLSEINKLITILENKKLTETEKNEQIAKDKLPLPSLNGDSFKMAELLKKLPNTWDKMNQQMALGLDRIDLIGDIKNRFEEINKLNVTELAALRERKTILSKMLLSIKELTKHTLNIDMFCPKPNMPSPYFVCPDANNPFCDSTTKEYLGYQKYRLCNERITNLNKQMESVSATSDAIANDPNLVGIEAVTVGPVGTFYKAKIKNPDGTFTYKSLGEGGPQYDPCSNGGVVAGPSFGPCPAGTTTTTPPTNSAAQPANKASSSSGSAPATAPKAAMVKAKTPKIIAPQKTVQKTAKDYTLEYQDKLNKEVEKTQKSVSKTCDEKPINSAMYVECPSKKPNPWCDPNSKERQQLEKYNGCVAAVNNHNEILDAQINLSSYLKTNKEFESIVKSPDTGLIMAKMKKENGEVYYLPLNYDPDKK